jgi:phosphatidylglycerol lysyltransferase
MKVAKWLQKPEVKGAFLHLIALGVMFNGLATVGFTLFSQINIHNPRHIISGISVNIHVLYGVSLLYLATLLVRRKATAWVVVVVLYGFILGFDVSELTRRGMTELPRPAWLLQNIVLPILLVGGLIYYRRSFKVKSDIRSFASATRFAVAILMVTFLYGVTGFVMMDKADFREEITVWGAAQRTIDQFDLTTATRTIPHTRKARIFLDSLNVISVSALAYAGLALFQPLRARFEDQTLAREQAEKLLKDFPASSEDYFKLWPHDKTYFFSETGSAFLAYKVQRGVALVVGDPGGDPARHDELLNDFLELCETNDWLPAFVHTEPTYNSLYKDHGFSLQKIGEEAVINLDKFNTEVRRNKYFRNVHNKFTKQGYTVAVMQPPHSQALLLRLKEITDDWLKQPGRSERGFMMGYHTDEYMQASNIAVLKDDAGTIRAFMNQITSYDTKEANYDLLRSTANAQSNSNDYLLMGFLDWLQQEGFERLNVGLCPLAGLHSTDQDSTVIDTALRFVYANGDRLYSFSGLHRFKAKYEPEWSNRYIVYRGGVRNFTRVLNALNAAMKVKSS